MFHKRRIVSEQYRMGGPAAAKKGGVNEVADFINKLNTGVVEFEFYKHTPEGEDIVRRAKGTRCEKVVPVSERKAADPNYDSQITSYEPREAYIIWYWDMDKNALRCFNTNRFNGIIKYTPATSVSSPVSNSSFSSSSSFTSDNEDNYSSEGHHSSYSDMPSDTNMIKSMIRRSIEKKITRCADDEDKLQELLEEVSKIQLSF